MAIADRDFEALLSASGLISVFVWDNSPGFPVLYVTENVVRLLGITKRNFERFGLTYERLVHPDDYPRICADVEQAMQDPTIPASFTHDDYRLVRADGEVIWVADTTIIQRDDNGEVDYLFGYIIDITQRKSLELALEQERHRLALLIEGTRVGIWDWNPQTNAVSVNQRWSEMLGVTEQELPTSIEGLLECIHAEDVAGYEQKIQAHLNGETQFYESIHRMLHSDGSYLYMLDRGRVTERDKHGQAIKFISTLTDISSQKEAELKALRAAQAKTLFLANISHEIRTPLHGILGIAGVLENTQLNVHQQELVGTIKRSGDYLLRTLNDVLDLTGAEEGKLKVTPTVADPRAILRHIQQLFSETVKQKGLSLTVVIADDLPHSVSADHARLIQIMSNLLSNSIKFTEQGDIRLELSWQSNSAKLAGKSTEQGLLILQVVDSGIGIRDTERIWHMFEQEESNLNRKHSGSGLGLAIVRSLVELMQGEVRVRSELGVGTEFRVAVPVGRCQDMPGNQHSGAVTPPPVTVAEQSGPNSWEQLAGQLRVLIVDDSDVNQLILAEMLNQLQIPFAQIRDANSVMESVASGEFDIVFMDIHLPDIDGLELTRQIRQNNHKQPYIIALTADAFTETKAASEAAGMNDYITKPFLFEHIQAALLKAHHQGSEG
ncbi:MAG: PAS domain-containing protein [Idiomarina sp.]